MITHQTTSCLVCQKSSTKFLEHCNLTHNTFYLYLQNWGAWQNEMMHSLRIEKTPGLNSNDAIGWAVELNLIKRFLVNFKPNQAKHSD